MILIRRNWFICKDKKNGVVNGTRTRDLLGHNQAL